METLPNGLARNEYIRMRARYAPEHPKLIFVLESPPKSGLYFYDPTGRISEPLFGAMMTVVLGIKPATKDDGLTAFAARGCLLVDATYSPVNHDHLSPRARDALILQDFPLLEADLRHYAGPDTSIVLVKTNVCDMLEARLISAGFTVLNNGKRIPFPSTGQQGRFRVMMAEVLSGGASSPDGPSWHGRRLHS